MLIDANILILITTRRPNVTFATNLINLMSFHHLSTLAVYGVCPLASNTLIILIEQSRDRATSALYAYSPAIHLP